MTSHRLVFTAKRLLYALAGYKLININIITLSRPKSLIYTIYILYYCRVPGVTAQRIMTLLSEIGHSNKIERDSHIPHILHCSHCSGPVVSM